MPAGRRTGAAVVALVVTAFLLGALARQLVFDLDLGPRRPIAVAPVVVRVQSTEQAVATRDALREYIFGGAELPLARPTVVGGGAFTVVMQNGVVSHVRLLRPERPNGRLAIYHAGHAAFGATDQPMIHRLLADGYAVLVFDMPLLGVNGADLAVESPNGPITVSRHDHMGFLDPLTVGSPIRYFVEPVAVMLNQFEDAYADIVAVGLSGGGWTITLAAAVDPRIDRTYPVAGSLPLALDFADADSWGDWEQTEPGLYGIAGYEDLYVLGAQARRELQVVNEHDPCCFAGDHRSIYEPQVKAALRAVGGGSFDVFVDTGNRQHSIGPRAIEEISSDLAGWAGG